MKSIFAPDIFIGKKILITGASSGIGKTATLMLAKLGADLVISGRNLHRLNVTQSEILGKGACSVEAAIFNGFNSALEWMHGISSRYGPFDGVFHAAGEAVIKPMRLVKQKDFDQVINPSLAAAAAICAGLSRKNCLHDGAAIVFMSSVAGSTGHQGLGLYSASKAAIDGLTRSLAIELAPRGIRVNSIAAGAVRSEMHHDIEEASTVSVMSEYESLHPLGFGEMDDVANIVTYLLSDAGRWVTGSVLTIDGGYSAK